MNLVEFLEARIAEDEAAAHPQTVIISGGYPAPEVVNCIGVRGTPCTWRLDDPMGDEPGWWKGPAVTVRMREHELTHVTPAQRRALAECAAKRAIIGHWGPHESLDGPNLLSVLATVYKDHPDYRDDWPSAT